MFPRYWSQPRISYTPPVFDADVEVGISQSEFRQDVLCEKMVDVRCGEKLDDNISRLKTLDECDRQEGHTVRISIEHAIAVCGSRAVMCKYWVSV